MNVGIIDYGMGNLASVSQALDEISIPNSILSNSKEAVEFTHLILPGVGSFSEAMDNLTQSGWVDAIRNATSSGVPFLGICLGMQLLGSIGMEHGETQGLNLIPGQIIHFREFSNEDLLFPHVGWNEIHITQSDSPLLHGVKDQTDFYFVHSFVFNAANDQDIIAKTPYAGAFASTLQKGNVYGTQFHPEKSGPAGFQILKNFVSL